MNLLEKGFSIILNNNLEILWISEDFSLYLGYHTDELIGEPVSKIVETDIKVKLTSQNSSG